MGWTAVSDFVYFTKTTSSGGGGPNTFTMTNTQVNPGGGGSACMVSLGNYTGTGGVQEIFDFQSVHFENSAAAYTGSSTNRGIFCSDSTVSYIRELNVSGSQFNNSGGEPLFVLNSATAQEMWDFEGSYFICSATNLTLNPISGGAQPAYKNTFKNNSFCGASTTGLFSSTLM